MLSVILTIGLVGFGYEGGLIPELRLGIVAVAWCRGVLRSEYLGLKTVLRIAEEKMSGYAARLDLKRDELGRFVRRARHGEAQ